jgi:hypothetical protein
VFILKSIEIPNFSLSWDLRAIVVVKLEYVQALRLGVRGE